MGIKFKSPLALSAHRAIAHSDDAQTLEVTVVTKTAAHPEFGNGSTNGYSIDGVEGPYLEFTPGNTYKFDQSDSSNTGHPLAFYEDAAKTTSYTSGVTTVGTPGSSGAYTQIIPTASTPPILYYQCTAHSLMGSYTKFGTGSQGDTYTFSASQDGDNVDLLLDAGSGTDSTVQLTAGTNVTLTRNSASEVTIDASGEAESALKILLTVKNVSGGSLSPGTLVRVAPTATPPSGNVLEVDVADNSASSTMPAIGILIDTIADQAEGNCVAFGRAAGFSTSGYTEGDPIWVGSSGAFTGTKPTGTALIQRVGQIIKVHSSNGSIEVFGAGRSNDVPNIPQDQLWLGNSSGVATATSHTVENISNVTTSSKIDGQSLVWDATNNYWKNATVSGGGGGTVTEAFKTFAVSGQSDIVADGPTDTLNVAAGSNITLTTDATTDTLTIASTGAGGGNELSIETNEFTATANQTAFVISSEITSSSSTQVYIDGVYQSKDNYTTSGSTVTFSTGVPVNSKVEIVHFISVLSKVYTDDFTGDGSTVAFTASNDVTDENVTQIYIDGVYQSKDNYSTSGTTITFSTAPPNGSAIEVVHFVPATYSTLNSNQFTGTGSQTDFTLTQSVEEDSSFVFLQGVYQEKSTYSISGTTLTFTTAPQSGYSVEVITVGQVSMRPDTIDIDNFSGTGSQVDYTLTSTPSNENAIDVYINGLYQQKDTFSLSGKTLTFSTAPPNNSTIEVKHQFIASVGSGSVDLTAGTGIGITENSTNNFTISSSVEAGVDWQSSIKTADFTAVAGKGYFVNTTSSAVTVTLPSSPSLGNEVHIVDYAGTADTNKITITSSDNINSAGGDVFIDYERGSVAIVYIDATQGWVAYNAANESSNALAPDLPLTVDYLVAAGGGGGGGGAFTNANGGGGGGAGGLRTSYGSTTGGGGSSENSLSLAVATNYTVTIGAGGNGGPTTSGATSGSNGSNSVFSTITSTGGGGAGGETDANGKDGGSGGGASSSGTGGSAVTSPVVQGYNSGTSVGQGAGGGGAAALGSNSSTSDVGGDGGAGLTTSITGVSESFAGGGGGGGYNGVGGSGGIGGGGDGGQAAPEVGSDGTNNTGGGGGGSRSRNAARAGGAGGSGVVILRYPNSYTITIGSGLTGTTQTTGTDKVTTFTAGTGNITFS